MDTDNGLGEKLLTPQDVADYLGIPVTTLHYWRRTGEGPVGIRVGRLLRYEPEAVRRYRDAAKTPGRREPVVIPHHSGSIPA